MKNRSSMFLIALITMASLTGFNVFAENQEHDSSDKKPWEREPVTVEVVLKKKYIDGFEEQKIKQETIWSMRDFWSMYDDWKVIDQSEERMVLLKNMDELSPIVREYGYFGLDEDNILTIFKGKPEKEEAIQSFFQVDVGKLESFHYKQLREGIKVRSKGEFKKVIQTYTRV